MGLQISERLFGFLGRKRLAVKIVVAAQNVDYRIALHGFGNDCAWLTLGLGRLLESAEDGLEIVAVDLLGEPAKGFPARGDGPQVENLCSGPGLLIAVLVD